MLYEKVIHIHLQLMIRKLQNNQNQIYLFKTNKLYLTFDLVILKIL